MSLGIVFKGPEGIVLAADSRVTLNAQLRPDPNGPVIILPSYYDNATKLLKANGHDYVGAVTFGLGAIGTQSPRTAHSFMPEFESRLTGRLSVEGFAEKLSEFFMEQYNASMTPAQGVVESMTFFVAGFDENAIYGRVFEFAIPARPQPKEWHQDEGSFGVVWGGQRQFVDRLIKGYDAALIQRIRQEFDVPDDDMADLQNVLQESELRIPYPFLPLQDCVDLAIFLIRTTITLQTWMVDVRGVGGFIDVATITRTEGFKPIQQKYIKGEELIFGGQQ